MGDWYKDWFASEFYLKVYAHRNNADAENLFKLILNNIEIPTNAKILDAACGNGRHSIKFAELGYKVIGFDLSKTLLQVAQKSKLKCNSTAFFFCSDIRNIPIKKTFNLILNLFTSFGYFKTDSENFALVDFASKNLSVGGYFVFDYLNPEFVKKNLIESSEKIIDRKRIIERRKIKNNRVEKEIVIIEDEFRHRYFESVQLYSFQEILTMFKHFGFYSIKEFGNYSGDIYNENSSERMIIIFKK
ncbi:MAG: class I SAM-dependent methyltransferase [Melioribacteraceae bacterium]|nr:class I SAM-dependent methyltransferase [Melioribacteraceae bacterium]